MEFALIAVPLILLLFGIIEYGRLLWTSHALNQTAAATARCLALPQIACEGGIEDAHAFAIAQARGWGVRLGYFEVMVQAPVACQGVDGFASARVQTHFASALPEPLIALVGGPTITAHACFPMAAS